MHNQFIIKCCKIFSQKSPQSGQKSPGFAQKLGKICFLLLKFELTECIYDNTCTLRNDSVEMGINLQNSSVLIYLFTIFSLDIPRHSAVVSNFMSFRSSYINSSKGGF